MSDGGTRGGEGGESIRAPRSIRSGRGAPRNTVLFLFAETGTSDWRGDGRLGLRFFRTELDWSIIGGGVECPEECELSLRSGHSESVSQQCNENQGTLFIFDIEVHVLYTPKLKHIVPYTLFTENTCASGSSGHSTT